MVSRFIEELKQSKFYSNMLDNHEVVMMFVSGSRMLDVTDERSDYDVIAIVNAVNEDESDEYLTYEGLRVHWYYIPLANFIAAQGRHVLQSIGAVQFANIRDEVIVFSNPQYDAVCSLLLSNKDEIAANGVEVFCKRYGNLIDSVVGAGEIAPKDYTKMLYHLCVASLTVVGERLTEKTRSMLRQLKRIRWQTVNDEALKWCVERLTLLKILKDGGNLHFARSIL